EECESIFAQKGEAPVQLDRHVEELVTAVHPLDRVPAVGAVEVLPAGLEGPVVVAQGGRGDRTPPLGSTATALALGGGEWWRSRRFSVRKRRVERGDQLLDVEVLEFR